MTLGLLFWIIFVVWIIFGWYVNRTNQANWPYVGVGAVLLFLLGWQVFGFVIHKS